MRHGIFFMATGIMFAWSAALQAGEPFTQAVITQVTNDVKIVNKETHAIHPAALNDVLVAPDILQTGPRSRCELRFKDGTVTRVAANTAFSMDPYSRGINLDQGSILFHAPHGMGGGNIQTSTATAAVTGTTITVSTTANGGFQVMALEGQCDVKVADGGSTSIKPGQLTFVLPGQKSPSPAVNFNLQQVVARSPLIQGFSTHLDSMSKIIAIAEEKEKSAAELGTANENYSNLSLLAPLLGFQGTGEDQLRARVIAVKGVATYDYLDSANVRISAPSSLPIGAIIRTGADGELLISPYPGVESFVGPNSEIRVTKIEQVSGIFPPQILVDLDQGKMVTQTNDSFIGVMQVQTPQGIFTPQGGAFLTSFSSNLVGISASLGGSFSSTMQNGERNVVADGLAFAVQGVGQSAATSIGTMSVSGLVAFQSTLIQMGELIASSKQNNNVNTLQQTLSIIPLTVQDAILTDFIAPPSPTPAPTVSPVLP